MPYQERKVHHLRRVPASPGSPSYISNNINGDGILCCCRGPRLLNTVWVVGCHVSPGGCLLFASYLLCIYSTATGVWGSPHGFLPIAVLAWSPPHHGYVHRYLPRAARAARC